MSRPSARLPSTDPRRHVRARSWADPLLAAVLVLAALLLIGARGAAAAPRDTAHSGATLHEGSRALLVDAAPRRSDVQIRRDRVWLDLPPLSLARGRNRFQDPRRECAVLRLGPGFDLARDLRLSHFRRRIPRMNSEDPPCG